MTTSFFHATAEKGFSVDSPQSPGTAWGVLHRIAFRVAFSFIVLALLPFPFGAGSFYETTFYQKMWFAGASWLSTYVLHLSPTPSSAPPYTLADNVIGYVELLCFVVLAGLAAIVLTLLDPQHPHYQTPHQRLRVFFRHALA